MLLRIFPEFYGEFVEATRKSAFSKSLAHGGNWRESQTSERSQHRKKRGKIFKVNLQNEFSFHSFLIFLHADDVFASRESASPWKDLFTFILTFCYINNDFLFIFRKPHNKYKLPLDLTGRQKRGSIESEIHFKDIPSIIDYDIHPLYVCWKIVSLGKFTFQPNSNF